MFNYQESYSLKQCTFSIRRQKNRRIKKLKRNNKTITERSREHANCKQVGNQKKKKQTKIKPTTNVTFL